MLRRINIAILFICLVYLPGSAQNSVFVLVDVSGSGPLDVKLQAKEIARELINNQFDIAKYSKWQWSSTVQSPLDRTKGVAQPLLDVTNNASLMIMPFGVKDRYRDYRIEPVKSVPGDVNNIFDRHYPTTFRDSLTYWEIAKAKAAGVAKSSGIDSYYQIEVTDALEDTNSGVVYTTQEWQLIRDYASTGTTLGTLFWGQQYRIIISRISLSNASSIIKTPIVAGKNTTQKSLTIRKPVGTQKKPTSLNPGSVTVSWECFGCSDSIEFTVSIYNTKDPKVKILPKKTTGFSATFNIAEPGIYRVSVAGDGISARPTYFNVEGKAGSSFFWVFLLLLLAALVAYYMWNKRRNERLEKYENPEFSKDSGGTDYGHTLFGNKSPSGSSSQPPPPGGGAGDLEF